MIERLWNIGGIILAGENQIVLGKRLVPVPLCLTQIPQKLDWSGIRDLKPTVNSHTDVDCILILFKEIIAVSCNNNNNKKNTQIHVLGKIQNT